MRVLQILYFANLTWQERRYLCERDEASFKSLFEHLGQDQYIRYNDFTSLSSKIMDDGKNLPRVRDVFLR